MPYTEDEINNNACPSYEAYHNLTLRDEIEYQDLINSYLEKNTGPIIRDSFGTIILFEDISTAGLGSSGNSYTGGYQNIDYVAEYFIYNETDELSHIINREFTEL